MLKQLYIKNFTLIDELNIQLHPGFSVITGETGAGKSIILGAIGLLLGNRADTKAIKAGKDRCIIEAHFDLSRYNMQQFFIDNDIDEDLPDTIIRRELTAAGKSRAFINDTPVSLTKMRELGEQLVDIHSQHQNLLLQKEDFQLNVVDIIAQDEKQRKSYLSAYQKYKKANDQLASLKEEIAKNRENEDFLRFQFKELDDAKLQSGEQEQLEQEADMLSHSEEIKTALYEADNHLSGENDSILEKLKETSQQLANIKEVYPEVAELAERIDSNYIELKDIAQEVNGLVDHVDFDPEQLEEINSRLDTLNSLQQKFHAKDVEDLIQTYNQLKEQISHIDNSDEDIEAREEEVNKLLQEAQKQARELTAIRKKAAQKIEEEMKQRLVPLGIPNVRFSITLTEKPLSQDGCDKVNFLFSANKSTPLQPVTQVASGGEIARVMLSIKAMISGAVKLPTIIFDEIDTGVSGKIAEKMAQIMDEMGNHERQVISITHLPQIASMGKHHYKVFKEETEQGTISHMKELSMEERVQEIAQMVSGSDISEAALANAKELLKKNMKKLYMIMIGLVLGVTSVLAQPAPVQKVAKSVFTLTTFNKEGGIIASTQGVFIDNKGTAISTFKPFIGATKATVVDASGKSMIVDAIMGADELYDVAKFRVEGTTTGAPIANNASASGSKVWLVPYSIKKPAFQQEDISSVEKFNTTYNYYIFSNSAPENAVGCPFANKDGQVIGLMHNNGSVTAIDANFAKQLHVTGLSSLDAALRESGIRTALPDKEADAITMFTLNKGQKSAEDNMKYANEFIGKFPTSAFGYKEKAMMLADKGEYAEADKLMQESIKKATNKDEAHSNYADLIYQKIVFHGDSIYPSWNADKALDEAQKAYAAKPQPIYKHQEAQINYVKKEYQKAYDQFMELTKTSINNGELYFEAAQAKSQMKAPDTEIKTLLDSAVSVGSRTGIVAPYYLTRAQFLDAQGKYREAITDYNRYDSIAHPLDPTFFYTRYKCELKIRQWQQALIDIARACYLNPQEPTYFAEWASLDIRVKRYEEGIKAAQACISLAPEYADGYLLLGILQAESGNKKDGITNLEKAKELGDTRADDYIKKYK